MNAILNSPPSLALHRWANCFIIISYLFLIANIVVGTQVSKVDRLDYLPFFNFSVAVTLFTLFSSIVLSSIGFFKDKAKRRNYSTVLFFALLMILFIWIEG